MKNIRADIFVPTSNRVDSLKQCLNSIDKQKNKNFRILIVGLKRDKGVEDLINSYKNLNILYFIQKEKGLISAANEAVVRARYEFFIRIDDDVILDKDWFDNIVKTFDSDQDIGGITGPTIMSEKGIASRDLTKFLDEFKKSDNSMLKFISWVYYDYLYEGRIYDVSQFLKSGVFTLGSNYMQCLELKTSIEVNNLEACNWSVRTDILKEIGGFDKIYVKGLGDYHESDGALKIQRLGYKLIFNPKVKLQHNVEIGIVKKARPRPYYRIQNLFIFYFRFFNIESLNQLLKFSTNVFMQNGYYLYRFFTTGSLNQLGALFGTFVGLYRVLILGEHEIKKD